MIKEGLLRTYARAKLMRNDSQLDPLLINEFLDCPAYLRLSTVFDQYLAKSMASFLAKRAVQSNEPAVPEPAQAETGSEMTANNSVSHPPLSFRLPNARVGEPYSEVPMPLQPQAQALVFLELIIPPELGLYAHLSSGTLSGTPLLGGDFEIKIRFHLAGETQQYYSQASLLVNQNPKSMWKDLPSDQSDIFWKPDQQCSIVKGGDFRLIAASKRGRSHAHIGSFRDDDYLIAQVTGSAWCIAVVSDGAGSAQYSRRGSQIICRNAAEHLQRTLESDIGLAADEAAKAFHSARSSKPLDPARIDAAYQQLHARLFVTVGHAAHHAVTAIHKELADYPGLNAAYKDFSSTAIISACRRFPFGTLCVTYWVGDGAAAVYSKSGGVTLLGDADSGEFSGQTCFLDNNEVTASALSKRTRFALVDQMTALILMTDGVSDPMFETPADLSRSSKWDELWQQLELQAGLGEQAENSPQRLLSWLDFWSQGNHDDRTIVLILPEK